MRSLGTALSIGQKTHQAQTASMIASARVLAMDALELSREIDRFVESNPFLERVETSGGGVGVSPPVENWGTPGAEDGDDLFDAEDTSLSSEEHLQQSLAEQLRFLKVSPRIKRLAAWIIGNLDEKGFLVDSLESLMDVSDYDEGLEIWTEALELVQGLDPPGVGARTPTESLVLQIRRKSGIRASLRSIAEHLLTHCQTEIRQHNPKVAARKLGVTLELVKEALSAIASLSPVPTSQFQDEPIGYITPELILHEDHGRHTVELNNAIIPQLRFDHQNFELLKKGRLVREDIRIWKSKANAARLFVHAVEQRFATICAVAQTLVDLQSSFFEKGDMALQPLTLQEVASRLDLSISTISRASAGKYILTARGVIELKSFFPSPIASTSGKTHSSATLLSLLRTLIAAEDRQHPLSDAQLVRELAKNDLVVARRTVAKYRTRAGIPPACVRRRT